MKPWCLGPSYGTIITLLPYYTTSLHELCGCVKLHISMVKCVEKGIQFVRVKEFKRLKRVEVQSRPSPIGVLGLVYHECGKTWRQK